MKLSLIICTAALLLSAFNISKKNKLKLSGDFIWVPGGTMYLGNTHDGPHDYDSSKRVSITSFYISRFEITNLQYRQFYEEISMGLSDEDKQRISCDSTGWINLNRTYTYGEPMQRPQVYYRHPAYNNYPVVNISYEGAIAYCKWLQQKIASSNPDFEIEVKLPSKIEWIYAAQGGRSQAMFPWGNYYLRNKKGEFMCNFKKVGDGAIYRNRVTGKPEVAESSVISTGGLNDRAFYTAEVKSFYPNDYGLYNICGNAAEMISEKGVAMGGSWNDYGGDVHILAQANYENSSPTVGFRPVIMVKQKTK